MFAPSPYESAENGVYQNSLSHSLPQHAFEERNSEKPVIGISLGMVIPKSSRNHGYSHSHISQAGVNNSGRRRRGIGIYISGSEYRWLPKKCIVNACNNNRYKLTYCPQHYQENQHKAVKIPVENHTSSFSHENKDNGESKDLEENCVDGILSKERKWRESSDYDKPTGYHSQTYEPSHSMAISAAAAASALSRLENSKSLLHDIHAYSLDLEQEALEIPAETATLNSASSTSSNTSLSSSSSSSSHSYSVHSSHSLDVWSDCCEARAQSPDISCKHGCGRIIRYHDTTEHELICSHVLIPCVNANEGCPVVLGRGLLAAHLPRCIYSLSTCLTQHIQKYNPPTLPPSSTAAFRPFISASAAASLSKSGKDEVSLELTVRDMYESSSIQYCRHTLCAKEIPPDHDLLHVYYVAYAPRQFMGIERSHHFIPRPLYSEHIERAGLLQQKTALAYFLQPISRQSFLHYFPYMQAYLPHTPTRIPPPPIPSSPSTLSSLHREDSKVEDEKERRENNVLNNSNSISSPRISMSSASAFSEPDSVLTAQGPSIYLCACPICLERLVFAPKGVTQFGLYKFENHIIPLDEKEMKEHFENCISYKAKRTQHQTKLGWENHENGILEEGEKKEEEETRGTGILNKQLRKTANLANTSSIAYSLFYFHYFFLRSLLQIYSNHVDASSSTLLVSSQSLDSSVADIIERGAVCLGFCLSFLYHRALAKNQELNIIDSTPYQRIRGGLWHKEEKQQQNYSQAFSELVNDSYHENNLCFSANKFPMNGDTDNLSFTLSPLFLHFYSNARHEAVRTPPSITYMFDRHAAAKADADGYEYTESSFSMSADAQLKSEEKQEETPSQMDSAEDDWKGLHSADLYLHGLMNPADIHWVEHELDHALFHTHRSSTYDDLVPGLVKNFAPFEQIIYRTYFRPAALQTMKQILHRVLIKDLINEVALYL